MGQLLNSCWNLSLALLKANYLNFRMTDLSPWILSDKEFKDDVESFKEYLKSLNKTFGSAGEGLRVYFFPVVINRLVGLVYYFNITGQHMHVTPKLSTIQAMRVSQLD